MNFIKITLLILVTHFISYCWANNTKEKLNSADNLSNYPSSRQKALIGNALSLKHKLPLVKYTYFAPKHRRLNINLNVLGNKLDPYTRDLHLDDSILNLQENIRIVQEYIEQNNRYIEVLKSLNGIELPVGIKKNKGVIEYNIIIKSMRDGVNTSYLTVCMSFRIPQNDKQLAFIARDVRFSQDGGLEMKALELVGDQPIDLPGNSGQFILKGDGRTFVEWDCNGFKSMSLDAEVIMNDQLFIPDTKDTTNSNKDLVKTRITTQIHDWNDLLVEVSLPPFQLTTLPGFGFQVQQAVFDFSDYADPPGLPVDSLEGSLPGLWRGIHIGNVTVRLPDQFEKKNNDRPRISGSNLTIDHRGFSGLITAGSLFTLEDGRLAPGWNFSIDEFTLAIKKNQPEGAGFGGKITLPVTDTSSFAYTAMIRPGNQYLFNVFIPEKIELPLWQATAMLNKGSRLEMELEDGKFKPSAILHGSLSIGGERGKLKITHLDFEGLKIQTEKPYVQVAALSLGHNDGKESMGGYGMTINNIGFRSLSDDELALHLDASLNLVGEKAGGFGGVAGIDLVSKIEYDGEEQKWKYDRIEISKIGIGFNTGAVKVAGSLGWFEEDRIYGDGIHGNVNMEVIKKIQVQAVALFGKKDGYRYWFADALASVPPSGSGLEIKKFGGGAYYRMKQATGSAISDIGRSMSGVVYVPDQYTPLGLKATVEMATSGSEKLFHGSATLEIVFNEGGGIRRIGLDGVGYFLAKPYPVEVTALSEKLNKVVNKTAPYVLNTGAAASAYVDIDYDVPNKTLHGNFEVFVNVAGGLITGVGAKNRAGWAVMHFSPDEWFIHIGNPDDPIGLEFLNIARTSSYFMVGDYIPSSPPPPAEVSEILGDIDLDYMSDLNALGTGKGLAFGSRFTMDTGDLRFLLFYARFAAGLGFDIMLKDYGNTTCSGRPGPIGIDGWYANGQAFAYLQGKIGIEVRLKFIKGKFEIMNIGAAAVMQAQLPNPTWLYGAVGGHYSILNGLVKGQCRFEVSLGEKCQVEGAGLLEGIEVIADLTPADGENEVSVFNTPQAVFNLAVEQEFRMMGMDDELQRFRIRLEHARIKDGDKIITGQLQWNEYNDVVIFNSHEILPPEKELIFEVKIYFEEYRNGNWVVVKTDGKKVEESAQVSFTTDKAPPYIDPNNVQYSYPLEDQYNVYKDQSNKGYIQLKQGQNYLFNPGPEWRQKLRLTRIQGNQVRLKDFNYNAGQKRLTFSLKGLTKEKVYKLEIVNLPAASIQIDENVQTVQTNLLEGEQVQLETKTAEGEVEVLQEKQLFELYFRTSKHATFKEKVASLNLTGGSYIPNLIYQGVLDFTQGVSGGKELLDDYEVHGGANFEPLVQIEADPGNTWITEDANPRVYAGYPLGNNITVTWRDADVMGVPPLKAVFYNDPQNTDVKVEHDDKIRGAGDHNFLPVTIHYRLPYFVYKDQMDLKTKIADYSVSHTLNYQMIQVQQASYPLLQLTQPWPYKIKYYLPGKTNPVYQTTKEILVTFQ